MRSVFIVFLFFNYVVSFVVVCAMTLFCAMIVGLFCVMIVGGFGGVGGVGGGNGGGDGIICL